MKLGGLAANLRGHHVEIECLSRDKALDCLDLVHERGEAARSFSG